MRPFIFGLLVMSCAVVAVFFLHYWKSSGDRLFGFFAAAFTAMGVEWFMQMLVAPALPTLKYVYLIRLFAFILIIIAIVDKNARERRR
ncbi:MAG: DUF5985 family protein [Steroidobacteraceae bacterium]